MFPPYPVISVLPPLPSGVTIAVAENHQTKSGALGPWGRRGPCRRVYPSRQESRHRRHADVFSGGHLSMGFGWHPFFMKWKIKHVPKHQPATYIMQGGVFASYKWATLPLNIDISIINHIVVIGVINQILLQHVTPAKKKNSSQFSLVIPSISVVFCGQPRCKQSEHRGP